MPDEKIQPDEMISANTAGKMLGVTGKTVIRMVEKGVITGYRIGNVWRFKLNDIKTYLDAHRYGPDRNEDRNS